MKAYVIILLSVLLSTGCTGLYKKTSGGKASHVSPVSTTQLTQSEDPKDSSSTETKATITEKLTIPPSSTFYLAPQTQLTQPVKVNDKVSKTNNTAVQTMPSIMVQTPSNAPAIYERTIKDESATTIGAAQKDVVRETVAKLNSMKWITWVGVLMFIFGIASLFYPPLRALINSTTTSLAIAGGGLLLIVLPVVVIGNEMIIFGIVGGAVALYFFSYRYGSTSQKAKVLQSFIDKNQNGIDDRLEKLEKVVATVSNGNGNGNGTDTTKTGTTQT